MAEIREATVEDLGPLLSAYEAVAAEPHRIAAELPIDRDARVKSWRERYIDHPDGCMFVAVDEDELVGIASVSDRSGLVDFGMLVSASHRRRGIGRALVSACVEWSRNRGAHKMTLEVWPANEPAIKLYESCGFVKEGLLRLHYRRKNGEIWDAIVMGLQLG